MMKHLIAIVLLAAMLLVAGCGEPEEEELVIDEIPAEPEAPAEEPPQAEDTVPPESPMTGNTSEGEAEEEPETEEEQEVNETVNINETEVEEIEESEVIVIYDFSPTPADLEIKVGTTVTWSNEEDNFMHIIGWSKMPVKPGAIMPGETWEHTFEEPGEYIWYSTPKPTVQGTITVTE